MQQALEAVVVDVVFELGEQSADEIAYENHLGLQSTQHRQQNGLECPVG